MNYKIGDLERHIKQLSGNVSTAVDELSDAHLIYRYWMEVAPFINIEKTTHNAALAKFIKKARKNTGYIPDSVTYVEFPELKKKRKTGKGKESFIDEKTDHSELEHSHSIKEEHINIISPIKMQKKIKHEAKNSRKSNDFSNIDMEDGECDKSIDSKMKSMKKKKNKKNLNRSETENTTNSSYAEGTLNSSFFDSSVNSNITHENLDAPSSKKQKKGKKKKLQSNDSNVNFSEEKIQEQSCLNPSDSFFSEPSIRKKKKNKFSNVDTSEISTNLNQEVKNESKKMIKKRTLSETENHEFKDIALFSDEQPKKKKKKFVDNEGDEIEQGLSKTEKKLKKRQKNVKGIIAGFDTGAELTKFTPKSDDDGDSENSNDDESFFPRTKNKESFVPKQDSEEKNDRTLFVGNLPMNVSKKTFKAVFKPFGEIESVRIRGAVPAKANMPQKVANIKKEYSKDAKSLDGFVVFTNKENAENALELNGKMFNGHHLRVDKAKWKMSSNKKYNSKASIFLGNLPFEVENDSIRNLFEKCGAIEGVRVVRDKATGRSKGFGFVEFKEESCVAEALNLSGAELDGREIRIQRCNANPATSTKFDISKNAQEAMKRIAHGQQRGDRGSGPKRFNKKFQKSDDDSGPKKSFKKFMKKQKQDHQKKKIAAIFKSEKKY